MSHIYTYINSPAGKILLLSDSHILTGLYFVGQKNEPTLDSQWRQDPSLDIFSRVQTQVSEYFAKKRQSFDIAYQFKIGTPFQHNVWNAITQVPYGTTLSYKELATQLGTPKSIRAVATAVGRNPLLLIVPCHRIIGSNGSLVGYAGGLQQKQNLLNLEQDPKPDVIQTIAMP
jgi:methylated-DNA-[protein]-cysteine S-methyltransferase